MKIALFGASGLAGEVAQICLRQGYKHVVLLNRTDAGASALQADYAVLPEAAVPELQAGGYQFLIAIGSPRIRARLHAAFPHLPFANVIHPAATLYDSLEEQLHRTKGNIVMAGVRMTSYITLGNFGIWGLNSTVSHDAQIEDYVTIGPGANVCGNVHLKAGAYIGAGAVVLPGAPGNKLTVGTFATVGAGAVVTGHVADYTVIKGVPAR